MADLGKIVLALFLGGFWLILPLAFQLFNIQGASLQDLPDIDNPQESTIGFFSWTKPIAQGLSLYFNLLTFNIPNLNIFIRYFFNILQLGTLIFIILLLRGD